MERFFPLISERSYANQKAGELIRMEERQEIEKVHLSSKMAAKGLESTTNTIRSCVVLS